MRMLLNRIKLACCIAMFALPVHALSDDYANSRVQVVNQQIHLLKTRYDRIKAELEELQSRHDEQISSLVVEKASKSLQDKAALDISVAKSNLDSINIELADSLQTVSWLDKNVQELGNQLNAVNIFGLKVPSNQDQNLKLMQSDLESQRTLLMLEKERSKYLQKLQASAQELLTFKTEQLSKLKETLKSRQLLYLKNKQVKDELAYQEDQNYWLQQLNLDYARLSKVDPSIAPAEYAEIERNIFFANEKASYAYVQSLIARYKDQVQQMKLAISRTNSITLLNEVSDQVQALFKQIGRLNDVAVARAKVLRKHVDYLAPKVNSNSDAAVQLYVGQLEQLQSDYQIVEKSLEHLDVQLTDFRSTLDHALKVELSSRQGLPAFGAKTLFDIGKELLLVPTLAFQILKSLSAHLHQGFAAAGSFIWAFYSITQCIIVVAFFFLRKVLRYLADHQPQVKDRIRAKWLALQFIQRNFIDIVLIGDILATLYFFSVPMQSYAFLVSLSLVWLVFKALITVARLWLVESTHDSAGHDVKLYKKLRWMIYTACIVTAVTVFMHQLPIIYELKILSNRLFLFSLLISSILLLKSWDVVPNMILSHLEYQHPYFDKSIRFIGIIIPLLLLVNSLIGLVGYVNLVMTFTTYQGLFLLVLVSYLILRGILLDAMMHFSSFMIKYTSNGWLWTEAFLKPLDKILRTALFLAAWASLFLLYGWDKQSPIVERLTRMLHYQVMNILNTSITPLSIIELFVVVSVFYWTAKWTREFVYRAMSARTKDMGIRNSIAVLSQYSVIAIAVFISLRVLGIDLRALAVVAGMFAFGIGLGLRDLANNFACGFLILLERPLRVGDIVEIDGTTGEVISIGSRAVTIRTWDRVDMFIPNTDIFNKAFTNWTAHDDIIRCIFHVKISRYDNPHSIKIILQNILANQEYILKDPVPEVYVSDMTDSVIDFELRYFVNIRKISSKASVKSAVLMAIRDEFSRHGVKPAYPRQEIFLHGESTHALVADMDEQIQLEGPLIS